MAVREGFEPSEPFWELGALAKLCFQPLSHLTSKEQTKLSGLCATRQMLNRGSARPVNNVLFRRRASYYKLAR